MTSTNEQIIKLTQEIADLKQQLQDVHEIPRVLEQAAKAFVEIELPRGAAPEDVLKIFRGLHPYKPES